MAGCFVRLKCLSVCFSVVGGWFCVCVGLFVFMVLQFLWLRMLGCALIDLCYCLWNMFLLFVDDYLIVLCLVWLSYGLPTDFVNVWNVLFAGDCLFGFGCCLNVRLIVLFVVCGFVFIFVLFIYLVVYFCCLFWCLYACLRCLSCLVVC